MYADGWLTSIYLLTFQLALGSSIAFGSVAQCSGHKRLQARLPATALLAATLGKSYTYAAQLSLAILSRTGGAMAQSVYEVSIVTAVA